MSSYVIAAPEALTVASGNLTGIGEAIKGAAAAAAPSTTGIVAAAGDEAVYTLSSDWINDIYYGGGPGNPIYGVYGPTGGYVSPGGEAIILGQASGIELPV